MNVGPQPQMKSFKWLLKEEESVFSENKPLIRLSDPKGTAFNTHVQLEMVSEFSRLYACVYV